MKNQDWKTQTKKNTKVLAIWTMAWTLSMAFATFGPKFIWEIENVMIIWSVLVLIQMLLYTFA